MRFPSVSRKKMQEIDRLAIEAGVSAVQLMELAGLDAAIVAAGMCKGKQVAVLCGKGNNAGDGMAAARHLSNWGFECRLVFPFHPKELGGEAEKQFKACKAIGVSVVWLQEGKGEAEKAIAEADLVLDALLGFGLKGEPRQGFAELIRKANEKGKKVLAIDIPSGLDANTGKAGKPCIEADATVTMCLPKKRMLEREGRDCCGRIFVGYIGVPEKALEKAGVEREKGFRGKMVEEL